MLKLYGCMIFLYKNQGQVVVKSIFEIEINLSKKKMLMIEEKRNFRIIKE